jgi:hydroxymethylglutaryl-CoA lyase
MPIKIYEMFMRDGLQSQKNKYNLDKKILFMKELNKCNFDCIEFGSTVSPKLIPQMNNSFELYEKIQKNENTKYTMLVPNISKLQKTIDSKINSFGLVCSVSDTFALKNQNKTSLESFNIVKEQLKIITENKNPDTHIRVYLSCSFGSPWEKFDKEYLKITEKYITYLLNYATLNKYSSNNFDIVISDTTGASDSYKTTEIIKLINANLNNKNKEYIAMHIHAKDDKFIDLINTCYDNKIYKYDSSMLGIGGCPFAEDKALGNISTVKLITHFQSIGECKNYDIEKLKNCEKEIEDIIDDNDDDSFFPEFALLLNVIIP